MTNLGNQRTDPDLRLPRSAAQTQSFASYAALWVLVLTGGVYLAVNVHHVSARVESNSKRVDAFERERDAQYQDMRDRMSRHEAQVEYLAKLALIGINDNRATQGKPMVPDEFPRADDGGK